MKASQPNQETSRIAFFGNEYPDGPFCAMCTSSNKVFPTLKPRFDADFVSSGSCVPLAKSCPNPDFNKEQNRWRMVRRMLVEAVADLLQPNGKVYLQSDVESVLLGMKEQFISYSKGHLVVDGGDSGHQMENPLGVASDWERHVLARGAPMYRTMLRKV